MGVVLVPGLWAVVVLLLLAGSACACASLKEPMLGSPGAISVEDPAVVKVAQFAVTAYNNRNNDASVYKSERLMSAKQQVVSGLMFFIEMYLGKTQCRKSDIQQLENCPFLSPMQRLHCNFKVQSIPWKNETTLLSDVCTQANI
ncbi:cystatin-like [Pristis pectinata]|uniref:cystatin-like n=1 Tax=Pristis pectinata TaxID=685728 RepID=UPI00223CA847|nr:cystatin-like [Pristis pectinata]